MGEDKNVRDIKFTTMKKTNSSLNWYSNRQLIELFKCLGDEHRLKILYLLSERGEMNVTSIGKQLKQSQPAVSHHLLQLRRAGLIDFRKDGKFNHYSLKDNGLFDILNMLYTDGLPQTVIFSGLQMHFSQASS